MGLPEKQYFKIDELEQGWRLKRQDIRYYAETGLLQMQVWLAEVHVEIFTAQPAKADKARLMAHDQRWYNHYAAIEAQELRKVFRFQEYAIKHYRCPESQDLIRITDDRDYKVHLDDLMVTLRERDRFAEKYDLSWHIENIRPMSQNCVRESSAPVFRSFAGRPSVMYRIEQEMKRRAANGTMEPSLKKESEYLYGWATEAITDHQIPKPASIANALRYAYTQLKNGMNAAA